MDRRLFAVGVTCLALVRDVGARDVLSTLPPPNDKEIKKIRDGEKWPNPYVLVEAGRYELILPGVARSSRRLTLAQVEQALLALPVGGWPLGSVVAVGQNALIPMKDLPKADKAESDMVQMLRRHGLRADLWPSN